MEQWVCQSKFVKGDKIGVSVVRALVSQAEAVMEDIKGVVVRLSPVPRRNMPGSGACSGPRAANSTLS